MENKPYLIFNLSSSLYGIEVACVQEILPLPELTPIPDAPRDIVGLVNVRGDILPVMDLNSRLGYQQREYRLTDSIILVEWANIRLGLIVEQVHEVKIISHHDIQTELFHRTEAATHSARFIVGVAKVASDIVLLINLETLSHYFESVIPLIESKPSDHTSADENSARIPRHLDIEPLVFCPHATPEERVVFRQRAENLMRSIEGENVSGMIPLAVIGLNNEYFGLDLKIVREFTDIRKVTPIPCCPDYIVGNMNLRGEILTLVDISGTLKMPLCSADTAAKVMVVQVNDLVAGVIVEQVFDVTYLHPSQISPVPIAVHSSKNEYLRGTAPYREKMMSIVDLAQIITNGELTVNEEV